MVAGAEFRLAGLPRSVLCAALLPTRPLSRLLFRASQPSHSPHGTELLPLLPGRTHRLRIKSSVSCGGWDFTSPALIPKVGAYVDNLTVQKRRG